MNNLVTKAGFEITIFQDGTIRKQAVVNRCGKTPGIDNPGFIRRHFDDVKIEDAKAFFNQVIALIPAINSMTAGQEFIFGQEEKKAEDLKDFCLSKDEDYLIPIKGLRP